VAEHGGDGDDLRVDLLLLAGIEVDLGAESRGQPGDTQKMIVRPAFSASLEMRN
jgi:hypothetical protein